MRDRDIHSRRYLFSLSCDILFAQSDFFICIFAAKRCQFVKSLISGLIAMTHQIHSIHEASILTAILHFSFSNSLGFNCYSFLFCLLHHVPLSLDFSTQSASHFALKYTKKRLFWARERSQRPRWLHDATRILPALFTKTQSSTRNNEKNCCLMID